MAEGEDIKGGSVSSLTTDSLGSSQNENALSPEDLAWIDSCLTDVPEDSGSNLNPLRDVLMEVVNDYPEMFVSSSTRTRISAKEEDMGVPPPEPEEHWRSTDQYLVLLTHGEAETISTSPLTEEVSEVLALLTFEEDPSKNSLQYDILSTHENGFLTGNETHYPLDSPDVAHEMERTENGSVSEEEADSSSSKAFKDDLLGTSIHETSRPHDNAGDPFDDSNVLDDQIELSSKDVFKVWDLEIPVDENEEDEFEQQLKNALDESPPKQPLSRPSDDPVVLENGSIDDLIAGISDLSLTETFT